MPNERRWNVKLQHFWRVLCFRWNIRRYCGLPCPASNDNASGQQCNSFGIIVIASAIHFSSRVNGLLQCCSTDDGPACHSVNQVNSCLTIDLNAFLLFCFEDVILLNQELVRLDHHFAVSSANRRSTSRLELPTANVQTGSFRDATRELGPLCTHRETSTVKFTPVWTRPNLRASLPLGLTLPLVSCTAALTLLSPVPT